MFQITIIVCCSQADSKGLGRLVFVLVFLFNCEILIYTYPVSLKIISFF